MSCYYVTKRQRSLFNSLRYYYNIRLPYELQIYFLKSLRDVFLLVLQFFIENTAIQVVSTVSHISIPLRDLGFEFLEKIRADVIAFMGYNYQLSVESLAIIGVIFCVCHGTKGMNILHKGVRCLTIARALRVMVFFMTILPSPKPWCKFKGPIEPFRIHPGGVCNDLLYSGHVTVYTVVGTSFTILSKESSSKFLRYVLPTYIWFSILQNILSSIIQRHHYSIDMFLGFIVVTLIWQCKPLHRDLPVVPQNLFIHLKQLFVSKYSPILRV